MKSIFTFLILIFLSANSQANSESARLFVSAKKQASWEDKWWLNKTSRTLRGGDALSANENADALIAKGKNQVVDQFVADPRFADSILNFSLMYLGFRQDEIKDLNGNYVIPIFPYTQAIVASQEVARGGDFFKLFDVDQKIFIAPVPRTLSKDPLDARLSDADLRTKFIEKMQGSLDDLIALALNDPSGIDKVCTGLQVHVGVYLGEDPLHLFDTVPFQLFFTPTYYGGPLYYCASDRTKPFDLLASLKSIQAKNAILFGLLQPYIRNTYLPKTVGEIKTLDVSTLDPTFEFHFFDSSNLSQVLPNSSTNYNRKRSAYVLKKFLCDDLNPVNVENPSTHAGDVHGSTPSCFSCHYKLDPMAGFFRFHGQNFTDYTHASEIRFDDGATEKIADYVKAWEPGPDAAHPLNVGYIRSTQSVSSNFYGSTTDDLLKFLKSAPEAKRCLVKRAYEYLVSDTQTLDGDYLDYLTANFIKNESSQGSSIALKNLFKTIVLAPAFSTHNADRNQCYDHAPGYNPRQNAVPCKVASILNASCIKCHASTQGPQGQAGLDLSHWVKSSDGSFGFPHLNADGNSAASAKTFQLIIDRITSTEPDERMPYLSDMASQDRQQLYLWLNDLLKKGSK